MPLSENHNKIPLIAIDAIDIIGPKILKEGKADNFKPRGHPISKKPATIR
jgi:hypothetical protein